MEVSYRLNQKEWKTSFPTLLNPEKNNYFLPNRLPILDEKELCQESKKTIYTLESERIEIDVEEVIGRKFNLFYGN